MSELGAKFRSGLFFLVMITSLGMFLVPSESTAGYYFAGFTGLFSLIYIIVGVISILIRLIKRAKMDESDKMKEALMGFVVTTGDSNVINFFRRLSFWGALAYYGANPAGIYFAKLAHHENAILQSFFGFYGWSVAAFIFSFVVSIIHWIFYMPHFGEGSYTVFQYILRLLKADLMTPFRVIKNAFSQDAPRGRSMFYLVVMILFIIIVAISVLVCKT